MAAHGVVPSDLAGEWASANLKSLLRAQIARAREFYRQAETGIPLLADDGSQFTVWLMRHVYGGILGEVEKIGLRSASSARGDDVASETRPRGQGVGRFSARTAKSRLK